MMVDGYHDAATNTVRHTIVNDQGHIKFNIAIKRRMLVDISHISHLFTFK